MAKDTLDDFPLFNENLELADGRLVYTKRLEPNSDLSFSESGLIVDSDVAITSSNDGTIKISIPIISVKQAVLDDHLARSFSTFTTMDRKIRSNQGETSEKEVFKRFVEHLFRNAITK